jgi:hypothetical protein
VGDADQRQTLLDGAESCERGELACRGIAGDPSVIGEVQDGDAVRGASVCNEAREQRLR